MSERTAAPPPRPRQRSETLNRVLWAIPWGLFAIAIIVVGGGLFAAAIAMLAAICIAELFTMVARAQPFALTSMVVSGALIASAYLWGHYAMVIALVLSVPVVFIAAAVRGTVRGATGSVAISILGIVWIGLPFAHAVLLRELPDHGAALLFDVLIATIVSDTAAYAGGRAFGRRKLAGEISPNKTLEGLAFGIVGGTVGFWFAGLYQDWLPGAEALVMGAAVALVAPVGDLFESMIKRDMGVKDSGNAVGPHGGLLDRLDAVIFTMVAGFYLAVLFVY